MKKTVFSLVAALAFGAVADTTVDGVSMLGYTAISNNASAYLPLAIQYDSGSGKPVMVADVVQTSMLAAGDKLYVYNHKTSRYDTYELSEQKTWTPCQYLIGDELYSPGAAAETVLEKGYGFWLQRGETSRTNCVCLLGRLADSATFTVAGGTKATHTLLGVATDAALKLTDVDNPPFASHAVAGDEIHAPQGDGSLAVYRYSKKGYWISTMKDVSLADLPSGSSYWYVRKAGCEGFTVTLSL